MKRNTRESTRAPRERRGERGATMVISVIGMLALILATGLAVDISHFYTAKAQLQTAADAAALAAASQLNSTTGGIKNAVAEGTKALNGYDFKNSVTLTSANFTFATNINGSYVDYAAAQTNPSTVRFVKVVLPQESVGVTFSQIVLGGTKSMSATATAGMSVGLTMNKFYTAFTFVETAANPLVRGSAYSLAPKSYNDSSPMSYRVLTLADGSAPSPLVLTGPIHAYGYMTGGYTVAQLTATSPPTNLTAPSMCRSAQIGINTRFGDYTVHPSVNATDEPPDTITQENITYQQYTDMQGNGVVQDSRGVKNRRVITLPIVQQPNYNTSTRNVTADRVGAFFIKAKIGTSCAFSVEYIGEQMAVPVGTYSPGSPQSHDLSIPVLYK
ncbi:MAG TPA: pilus assembly protein TadG-related protein [Pyrinomonadaceae bacterium]|nr:pilus assembly protein TadG-related protein [Pyrinomonadaceae bacterium]